MNQLEWTAKSSEFLEKKSLKYGSMLFHIGILLVFLEHIAGLLIYGVTLFTEEDLARRSKMKWTK